MNRAEGTITKLLYRFFNCSILVCIVLFGAGRYFGIAEISPFHVIGAVGMTLFLAGIFYLKFRGRFLLVVGVLGGLGMTLIVLGLRDFLLVLENYGYWLASEKGWEPDFLLYYEILQSFLIAIICFLIQMISERYSLIRKIEAIALFALLIYLMVSEKAITHAAVAFILCFVFIVIIETIEERWDKTRSGSKKQYVLWLMPFILAYCILLFVTPSPKEPYEWKFVKMAYESVVRTFKIISQDIMRGSGEDFGLSMTGFSENGVLKGSVFESKQEVMKVMGSNGPVTNIYLIGKVFDVFDGRSWQQVNKDTDKDRLLDTAQTVYAATSYGGENVRNYVYSTSADITYQYFKTGYLFTPLKTFLIQDRSRVVAHTEVGGNLLLNKRRGYGTKYQLQFYQMNVDHPEFYHFLEADIVEDEEAMREVRRTFKYEDGSYIEKTDLEKHQETIHENYYHDIQISDELKNRLEEITKDCTTDIERLKAIEKELSSFEYASDIDDLPKDIDTPEEFLNYFMLDHKQGYCTYFATAFVLLAWEEGFPARYVQGFSIPMKKNKETTVYSNMAHAWPEVYVDEIGWIPFEPTPGYGEIRYTPWKMQDHIISDTSYLEGAGEGTHYWQPEPTMTPMPMTDLDLSQPGPSRGAQIFKILFYTVILVLLGIVLLMVLDTIIGSYRYRKKDLLNRYRTQMTRILRILAVLGYERNDYETLQELCDKSYGKDELSCIGYFEEILYDYREVTQDMLDTAKKEQKLLLLKLKEQKKNLYLYYRLSLFIRRYR